MSISSSFDNPSTSWWSISPPSLSSHPSLEPSPSRPFMSLVCFDLLHHMFYSITLPPTHVPPSFLLKGRHLLPSQISSYLFGPAGRFYHFSLDQPTFLSLYQFLSIYQPMYFFLSTTNPVLLSFSILALLSLYHQPILPCFLYLLYPRPVHLYSRERWQNHALQTQYP